LVVMPPLIGPQVEASRCLYSWGDLPQPSILEADEPKFVRFLTLLETPEFQGSGTTDPGRRSTVALRAAATRSAGAIRAAAATLAARDGG